MRYIATIGKTEYLVEIVDETHVSVNGVGYEVDFQRVGDQPVYSLLVNGRSINAHVQQDEEIWQVLFQAQLYPVQVEDEREKRLRASLGSAAGEHDEFHLKAPMPGLVVLAAFAGAAGSLGGGAGQVTAPSLMTVRPRMASSSMLTSMTPSFVLHSSSVRRNRFVAYSVEDCLARRLARSV